MKNKAKFIIVIYAILLANMPSLANAQQTMGLPNIIVQPGMFIYPFMRLEEKIFERFQFNNEAKGKYYQDILQKRLAELKIVVDNNYLDEVEKSSQRVSYQVGILSDYIKNKNLNNKKNSIQKIYQEDKVILEKLRDKYQANTSFWMLIQHVINSIDFNSQKF